jgi:hypothetical protein
VKTYVGMDDGQRAGLSLTRGVTSSSQHCGECPVDPEDRDHALHIVGVTGRFVQNCTLSQVSTVLGDDT